MTALLVSIGVVALAEIADKTQLLALVLAARFRKPWPIIFGIFFATLANHFLAGAVGTFIARQFGPDVMRWALGLSFIAMAVWMMIPDKIDETKEHDSRFGVFGTTLIAFFLVEMGDKTQLATAALGARYQDVVVVTMSTTIGMMLVNVPAVFLGHKLLQHFSLKAVRLCSALMFFGLGVWMLFQ